MLTEEQKLIASLPNDPAYRALISYLEEENAGLLADLAVEAESSKILNLTRFWQASSRILSRLKLVPETVAELIDKEREKINGQTTPSYDFLGEEDNPFLRPSRPIPPPYQNTL